MVAPKPMPSPHAQALSIPSEEEVIWALTVFDQPIELANILVYRDAGAILWRAHQVMSGYIDNLEEALRTLQDAAEDIHSSQVALAEQVAAQSARLHPLAAWRARRRAKHVQDDRPDNRQWPEAPWGSGPE